MYYAVKQENNYWHESFLEFMVEGVDIVITGNKRKNEYNTDNDSWRKVFGDDGFETLMGYYVDNDEEEDDVLCMLKVEYDKPDGTNWCKEDARQFKISFEKYLKGKLEGYCELLDLLVGGNWCVKCGTGMRQGDWNYFYYNTAEDSNGFKVSENYVNEVIDEYFGNFDEWLVGESINCEFELSGQNIGAEEFIRERCDHWYEHIYYCNGYLDDAYDAKRVIARKHDKSPDEVKVFLPYTITTTAYNVF